MHYFFIVALFFWVSRNKFSFGLVDIQSIYSDLKYLEQTCDLEKCSSRKGDSLLTYDCHCDSNCVQFDTCCLDSHYVQAEHSKQKTSCIWIYNTNSNYFMIDRCPTSDSIWESQCREKISYGEDNDILKIVPVTSLLTSYTYKNYFCFRCHENKGDLIYWNAQLRTKVDKQDYEEFNSDFEKKRYSLTFENGSWKASFQNDSKSFHLTLSVKMPKEVEPLVKRCEEDIIMNCSAEWTDSEMREKCQAYMGVREVKRNFRTYRYKNMHCAFCNFEHIDDITCRTRDAGAGAYDRKSLFSFTHLLDINNSDGDKVGQIQRCHDDHVWDSYAKRCRKLTCAIPGYQIKNGKCNPQ